ncbi:oligosaccharide flippase family protein [Alcaligenaceae bacterium]|nr:oligosaccharide flippase family protein [Alcaligenaceae bacterium]
MINKFPKKNEFASNVLILMTGTVIGQAIPIAIIPILTRIFTPEDFGLLALYSALISILSVIATGRYEIAVMLPKEDDDAKVIVQAAVFIALGISLVILVPILIWNQQVAIFLGNTAIAAWLYLLPLSVFLTGVYQALTYWNNRQKKFKNTAFSRINQSLFQSASQASLGFIKVTGGLIFGQFIGIASSTFYLLKKDNVYKVIIQKKDNRKIKQQLKKYKKFPKYGMFGALCDAAASQMPVLILTKFYSSGITGIFSLTFRVLNMPTSIISSAITQVLFQKVVELSHTEPQKLKPFIIKMFLLLFIVYLPVVPILLIWGDTLFAFVFGEEWRQAGIYAGYLAIAVAVRFTVSPLSSVLGLEENVEKGVFWQVLYLFTITLTLYFCSDLAVEQFIVAFVIHEVILYIIYMALIIKGIKAIA